MADCACAALAPGEASERRLAVWRETCIAFFYEHDAVAKRVLEHFEEAKLDAVMYVVHIEPFSEQSVDPDDVKLHQLRTALEIKNCFIPEHQSAINDYFTAMEKIKNNVRSEYHHHVALQKYGAFDARVNQEQGDNCYIGPSSEGAVKVTVRIRNQDDQNDVRTIARQTRMLDTTTTFVKEFARDIACHPFLAGLRQVLNANIGSPTVIAWNLSDAVFVEAGPTFIDAALHLLVNALNFVHYSTPVDAATVGDPVHTRVWQVDPYMSDRDLLQVVKLLPPPSRLEARATGTTSSTEMLRLNVMGAYDEHPSFIQKWCVIL